MGTIGLLLFLCGTPVTIEGARNKWSEVDGIVDKLAGLGQVGVGLRIVKNDHATQANQANSSLTKLRQLLAEIVLKTTDTIKTAASEEKDINALFGLIRDAIEAVEAVQDKMVTDTPPAQRAMRGTVRECFKGAGEDYNERSAGADSGGTMYNRAIALAKEARTLLQAVKTKIDAISKNLSERIAHYKQLVEKLEKDEASAKTEVDQAANTIQARIDAHKLKMRELWQLLEQQRKRTQARLEKVQNRRDILRSDVQSFRNEVAQAKADRDRIRAELDAVKEECKKLGVTLDQKDDAQAEADLSGDQAKRRLQWWEGVPGR